MPMGTACSTLIDLQNCLNLSETKFFPASDIIFHSIPYLVNIAVTALMRCSADSPCNLLKMGKFAVIVYNTKIVYIIKMEYICSDYFSGTEGYIMMDDVFFWLHLLKFKTCHTLFNIFFDVSIYAVPVYTLEG